MKNLKFRSLLKFSIILFFLFATNRNWAQSYGNTIGVRLGNGNLYRTAGITFQQRVLKEFTIEGIVQTDFTHNTTFHGLYEFHHAIITKRLNYYVGAGLMAGIEQDKVKDKFTGTKINTYGNSVFGADLIAGVEITLLKFNISLDYKPNFNITGRESWYQGQTGVSVRSVVLSSTKMNKNHRKHLREKHKKKYKKQIEHLKAKPLFKKKTPDKGKLALLSINLQ